MSVWRNDVLGFIPEADWLSVGFNVTRPNDPIDSLFGDQKTDNLVAEWQSIASEYQIPMMAQFHAFDTEAQKTFRIPVDNHNIEKGLIKVKINQSERLRQLTRAGVQGDERLYDYVMNDGIRLADQVVTRTKVAKNELLATGKVTIKENDLDLTVDYGVPIANLAHTLDIGNGATTDIATQLQVIIDAASDLGETISGMCLPNVTFNKMRTNTAIQKAIYGNLGIGVLTKKADLRQYLDEEFGLSRIIINDEKYGVPSALNFNTERPQITTKRYFPANKISFFATNPSGKIGVGLWGNPPEVDAARVFDKAGNSGVDPYVYITQWGETDPAVLWTKASALFMPVLYDPNSLFVATVSETPAA